MPPGTALVTGASAGLGEAFARALAERGHELILTARREARLDALAGALRDLHGVSVTTIPLDLAAPDAPARLIGEVSRRGLAVNLLINNAGFGLRGPFVDMDRAALAGMVDLNCRAVVELSHLVLPGMIQMRRGAILNIASIAGLMPGPWMATYYASKAFVLSFSQALHEEARGHGVSVTALCPGPVETEFGDKSGLSESRLFRMGTAAPGPVVAAGLAALERNRAVAMPGAQSKALAGAVAVTPRPLARRITAFVQKRRGG